MKPKTITMPELDGAKQMGAAELNNVHFSTKHTVLTPELLEKIYSSPQPDESDQNQ